MSNRPHVHACLCGCCTLLEAERDGLKIQCVNEHANAQRLIDWMNDPHRKPAIIAFTEGPEKQIAYAFENAWRNVEGP